MSFIKLHKDFINEDEGYLIVNGSIPDDLKGRINQAVEKYLSISRECSLSHYLPLEISIKSMSQKFKHNLNSDDELISKNDRHLIRDFSVVIFLSKSIRGELFFPLQNESVCLERGSLLIYPSSFMFPYKASENEGYILEAEYFVDVAPIIGSTRSRKESYIL